MDRSEVAAGGITSFQPLPFKRVSCCLCGLYHRLRVPNLRQGTLLPAVWTFLPMPEGIGYHLEFPRLALFYQKRPLLSKKI